ncbi:MAG: hypothetical protein JRH08_00685 [Deltaproteobacteria bacterium]|nr:hypothetical protein [Deltaproteobacteria bacterium]MBW2124219.1 hypothetical protein [Deltaproteobacteria bacterium]
MRVKILRDTVASGKGLAAGRTYDLSEQDAKILLAMGKAVPVGTKVKKPQERDSELVEGLNTRSASALIAGKKG